MRTRPLGRGGLNITVVGFGAWALGGDWGAVGWGPQPDSDSMAAIKYAVGSGVNWIDTAAVYGRGHSEEIVGRALEEIPPNERPLVFTKCGLIGEPDRPKDPARIWLEPTSIQRECETSLRRLRLDTLDLYQIHFPDDVSGTPLEESWGMMARLVEQGKARAIGVSNFNREQLERCESVRHVDSLQPPLSAIHRESAELLDWCRVHHTGVIVYSPMQSGLLTDRFSVNRVANFAPRDHRLGKADFRSPQLERNLILRDALKEIGNRRGVQAGAVAVAWTLAWPGVIGAIVGARSPEQVESWLPAANLELTDEELDEIAVAIERTRAGSGPARPPRS